MLGFTHEMREFFRASENSMDYEVELKEPSQVYQSLARRLEERTQILEQQYQPDEKLDQYFSQLYAFSNEKESNRDLYQRHLGGRRNKREEKRQKMRARLKARNKRIALSKIIPHSEEEEGVSEALFKYGVENTPPPPDIAVWEDTNIPVKDDPLHLKKPFSKDKRDEKVPSPILVEERNEMARAAASIDAFDKTDSQLASLLESVGAVDSFAEGMEQGEQIDEWIGHLENMVILGYQMGKAQSFMDVFVAVAAYAKMYSKKRSIVLDLYRIIHEVTTTCVTNDEVEPHSWNEWSGRDIMMKWELFKTNTIFKKISYLISAAMSLTVCTTKQIEWSPFGLQLISLEAAKEQLKAVDVIDALVKTFVWISEVGWKCFETKSIAPILYSDVKVQEYNENCDYVLAKADAAIAGNIDDLGAFEGKLNEVFKKTCVMKAAKNDGPTSLWLQKRYSELVAIMEKLAAKRKNTDLRFSPIGWSLHGGTAVGKSTLGKLTMTQSLAAMDFVNENNEVDDSRIITMDMFDKYNSTWTSDVLGVFMDDLNNTKSDFQKDNPHTSVIIKFFNNVAAQAIKAELNAKGVVFIDFKCGIVTSNVKDLGARQYSNCPESILRRFYHVEVVVREKYRKPGSLTLNKKHLDIKNSNSLVQDIWELTIEEIETFEIGANKTDYKFRVMDVQMDDGRVIHCEKLQLKDYLDVVIQLSKDHKIEQDSLIKKSRESAKAKFCKVCKHFPEFCSCAPAENVEPHAMDMISEVVVGAARKAIDGYVKSWTRPVDLINWCVGFWPVQKMTTNQLAWEIQREMNEKGTPLLVAITPDWLFETRVFQRTISTWQGAAAYYDIRRPLRVAGAIGLSLCGYGLIRRNKAVGASGVASLWSTAVLGYFWHQVRLKQIQDSYLRKRDALPEYAQRIRDGKFPKGVLFVATLALGVKLIKMWNDNRIKVNPAAFSPEDIDKQPGWFGFMMKQIGWKAESSVTGAIPEHVLKTGEKNQGWCEFTRSDGSKTGCNIIYPEKGYVWFPLHIFYPDSDMNKAPCDFVRGEVYRSSDKKTSKFKFIAELNYNAVFLKGLDMVEVFVERCPDIVNNLKKFLPLSPPSGISVCTLMLRNKDAQLSHEKLTVEHGIFGHKYLPHMKGGYYTTSRASTGSCMGMLVTEGKQPVVAGFHIGGNVEKKYGVMMTVTQAQAMELRKKMLSLPGIRGIAAATKIPDTQYGKRVIESNEVHPNSVFIKNLDENAAVDVLGSTRLRTEARSRVVPSVLRKDAEELFKITNCWGAPRLKPNWKAFNKTLEHIVNPSDVFLPSLLQRARQDWIKPILEFAKELHKKDPVRPLTMKEVIMGVPGKRFLEAIQMNTSLGYPLFGPKKRMFNYVTIGEFCENRIPDDEIINEYNRCVGCWKRGERAYPVVSSALKDEATPLESEKVRVYQIIPVALSMAIRKWFLPIARVLSLCPTLSECAVGVNSFSYQWDELMKHAEKFAEDGRVIAWDYSKYDVRMSSQMTYAVLQCFIDIAKVCGYSEEDLEIMNNMIADIIHPLMDFNGSMLMAYNMNTSGNNITVNINSVANSLYVRMGLFTMCPEVADFRKAVAAMTYGDDFKGSVHPSLRERFNFRTFKEFLAKHDIKITEPKKTDVVTDDLHIDEADFLKRHSQYIPEIGTRIGKLDKQSMYKPLLTNLKSKTETPEMVAVSCVETYMHELFAHGREEYEKDQPIMKELCERVLKFTPPAVNFSFDERADMWKSKYGGRQSGNELTVEEDEDYDWNHQPVVVETVEEEPREHLFVRAFNTVKRVVDFIDPDSSDSESENSDEEDD